MLAHFEEDFWNDYGLKRPTLSCLKLDSMTYNSLLFQIKEEIGFDDNGIWLVDKESSENKIKSFLNLAIEKDVDLAITPEYCFPWRIMEEIIGNNSFPSLHKLWVFGMASIKPIELRTVIESNNEIIWIYDKELVDTNVESSPQKFFDPVCFLMNTVNEAGEVKKIIIVQFKNYPFGGKDSYWERDNIILGRTFYVIKNQFSSAKLVTLICSDTLISLDFNEIQDGVFLTSPLLILHLQLNQKPTATNYKSYRNLLFQKGGKDYDKEVICLNWARNVFYTESGKRKIFNDVAGSALFLKSTKLNSSDKTINENHRKGMYYTNWDTKRAHMYILNFDEYVFLIKNTKVSQIEADPSQYNRTGPVVDDTYYWDGSEWVVKLNRVDEGFMNLIAEVQDAPNSLNCLANNENFLEVERLVQLCSGKINHLKKDWQTVFNLPSFIIDDNEISDRVTFDQQIDGNKKLERRQKLNNYLILKHNIIREVRNLPAGMDNVELKYSKIDDPDRYLLNLHSGDGKMHATGIYVGSVPKSDAISIRNNISDLFVASQYGKLVMLWYESVNGRQRIPETFDTPKISEVVEKKSNNITLKKKL